MRYILSLAAAAALIAAPLTRAQTAPTEPTLLVLPLTVSSDTQNQWLGRAAQQDLLADLTQSTVARVLAPANVPPAADPAAALKDARDAGANFVVYGQIQMTGKEIRMSGQVLEVATGKPLGAMKATGPSDQLFHLEDALESQVFSNLPPTLHRAPPAQTASAQTRNAPMPVIVSPPAVVNIEPSVQPQDNFVYPPQVYDDYPSYDYNYPGYDYPYDDDYGYYGGGPIIINGYGGYRHGWSNYHNGGRVWNGRSRGAIVGRAPIVSRGGSYFSSGFRGAAAGGFHGSTGAFHGSSGGFHGSVGGFHGSAGGFHGSSGGGFHGASGGGFHGGGRH